MTFRSVLFCALASGAVLLALALWGPGLPGGSRQAPAFALRPGDAALVGRGGRIYRAHCAACHGARLEGQPNWRERGPGGLLPAPPHDESGHTWHHPDELLFRITKQGVAAAAGMPDYKSAMPAFAGVLSDEEIVAVLSWIKSQWPAGVRERHDEVNAAHREEKAR